MKIIHTADWHLGQQFYRQERTREHALFLEWLCAVIKEQNADLLLIAGDLFDTPNPSAEAQKMLYRFLKEVTSQNSTLQIIITAGNHDSAARIEAPAPLLNAFNIHVSGVVHYKDGEIDYDRMIVPLNCGGCCLAVPYLRYNEHPAAESYSEGVSKMYALLYARAKEMGYSPVIAMGHLQASGAEVSVGDSSEHLVIGGMEGIDARFAGEGIAYMALGHLHKAQRVAHKENVRYSGAPLPMSFAEMRNKQSVTCVTIENGSCAVEKIGFDAPVKLLRIPSTPLPLDTVLEELAKLPSGDIEWNTPMLEVRVLVTSVDAAMRQHIEDALEGKAVRLVNIETVSNITRDEGGSPMTYDDFKKCDPADLMKEIFRREKGEDMPESLSGLLNEVMKEVKDENTGNQRL